ncbi:MAG: transposase [Acidobacteria bacterium]|nr:transposase [Acidobacteriota bacterium]
MELLFSAVSGKYSIAPGRGLSEATVSPPVWAPSRDLGWIAFSSQPHGERVCHGPARARLVLEFLPAYAPELNPVEYIWGYLKQKELPNLCPKNLGELSWYARRSLRRMRRRPRLVRAFWKQAGLFDHLLN